MSRDPSLCESSLFAEQSAPVVSGPAQAYVVIGTTGEYSDRSEWPVAVVASEQAAESYITALDQQYQRMPRRWHGRSWEYQDEIRAHMSLDPKFHCDYTGTSYFYCACPILSDEAVATALASAREVRP